ncbi:hypothetical protein GMRT_12680 [Giardia muris]|uniref:Uncharacterized protein n=1 Tax=Giardia muris TaxID=5742 RepID=A0A4Z1SPW4_GIAMU|nr:hypothetical protein GMRT_12680 [Giardia muris]|eukprot:TNJ27872.1 hypothetical protein GMRT_12680 [Giardia muris]
MSSEGETTPGGPGGMADRLAQLRRDAQEFEELVRQHRTDPIPSSRPSDSPHPHPDPSPSQPHSAYDNGNRILRQLLKSNKCKLDFDTSLDKLAQAKGLCKDLKLKAEATKHEIDDCLSHRIFQEALGGAEPSGPVDTTSLEVLDAQTRAQLLLDAALEDERLVDLEGLAREAEELDRDYLSIASPTSRGTEKGRPKKPGAS